MRVRSHWFRDDHARGAGEVARAVAFNIWRIAQQILRDMRRADFDIAPGPRYFDFLAEWLVFLIHVADRNAYERLGDGRTEFTTVLANRTGEILAENQVELLGEGTAAQHKARFIELLNLHLPEYSDFPERDADCRRYLAARISVALGPRDQVWVHDQVMEIEAPQAIETVGRVFENLFRLAPPDDASTRGHASRREGRPPAMTGE